MSGRRVLLPVEMAGRRDIVLVSVLIPGRHLVNLIVSAELTNKPPVTRNTVLVSTPGYMLVPVVMFLKGVLPFRVIYTVALFNVSMHSRFQGRIVLLSVYI